jgi:hypothetical protein
VPITGSAIVNAWGPMSLSRVTFEKNVAPPGKAIMFAENGGGLKLEQVQVLHPEGPFSLCAFFKASESNRMSCW